MLENYFVSESYLNMKRKRNLLNNRFLFPFHKKIEPRFNLADMLFLSKSKVFEFRVQKYLSISHIKLTHKNNHTKSSTPYQPVVKYRCDLSHVNSRKFIGRPNRAAKTNINSGAVSPTSISICCTPAKISNRHLCSRKGQRPESRPTELASETAKIYTIDGGMRRIFVSLRPKTSVLTKSEICIE